MIISNSTNMRISTRGSLVGTGAFNPYSLFIGSNGVLLDVSRLDTLRQDAAGSVHVTAAGQPVGLVLDLSMHGSNASQAVSARQPTYRIDAGGRPYLEFDGVDDWLTTPSIPLAAGARTIITALRKRSDAVAGAVVETRPTWTSTGGGIAQFAPSTSGPAIYGSRLNTNLEQTFVNTPASFAAPHTAVMSSVMVPGSHIVRINGQQVASYAPAGTIPTLTAALSVGSRDGSSFFAAVNLYGAIVIDRGLTGAELAQAEAWAAKKCGVSL